MTTAFEELKEICRQACHERNACKSGFEALMQTESVAGILQVWRDNWQDVYESKYADIIADRIVDVYARMRQDFVAGGVRVNEDADGGLLIVSRPQQAVRAGGDAKAYIFGGGEVTASDHAEVYCRDAEGRVVLTGHSQGFFKAGRIDIRDFAKAQGTFDGECSGAAYVILQGGTLRDYGHREISVFGSATVYSDTRKKITLYGDGARLLPLADYDNKGKEDGV